VHNLDDYEATFIFSEEAQGMAPYAGLGATGLKSAFYKLAAVPEILGASAGGKKVSFKDENGNVKTGGGFEWELMIFGAHLIGSIPDTVGEIIDTEQIMNLDCLTENGIRFPMEITFYFVAAGDQAAPTGLTGVAPTSVANKDGKITGTTTDMEYKPQGEKDWIKATETEISGLEAGTYEVRYAAKAGFNAGATAEVVVAEYVKSADTTLSDLTVNGTTVEGFAADTLTYDVELAAGTIEVPTVVATLSDDRANAVITDAASLPGSTTVLVTAEDGTTQTYTISFTVANADQAAPEGLAGVAPTIAEDNDGKITGVDDTMEYKLKSATVWIKVTGTEITGLAAGTYEVRYAAKEGYNAGGAAEVIVPEYEAPIVAAEIESVVAENGKVTITLKEKPTETPTAEDFSATIAIDGEEATTDLTLTSFIYDNNVTITFNFEAVEQAEAEQSVVVAVKLGEGDKVAAAAFIVDAEKVDDAAAAKQEFLEELDAKVAEKIPTEVAKYTREDDNLTVEFVTRDLTAIMSAAEGLAVALMETAYGSTLYIGDTSFVLNEGLEASSLANTLFSYLEDGVLKAPYSAKIIYKGASGITLNGTLTFILPV
jgi:hypothetical protein